MFFNLNSRQPSEKLYTSHPLGHFSSQAQGRLFGQGGGGRDREGRERVLALGFSWN